DVDVDAGAGFGVLHGQVHVAADRRAGLIDRDGLTRAPLLVLGRAVAVLGQDLRHGAQVVAGLLEEGVFHAVAQTVVGRLVLAAGQLGPAVDVVDAPILGQRLVARAAVLPGALGGLGLDLADRLGGCGLDLVGQQLGVQALRFLHAGHALGVQAGVIAGGLPER